MAQVDEWTSLRPWLQSMGKNTDASMQYTGTLDALCRIVKVGRCRLKR